MPTAASLETLKQVFVMQYAAWKIVLPAESLNERRRGSIVKNGWTIIYQSRHRGNFGAHVKP